MTGTDYGGRFFFIPAPLRGRDAHVLPEGTLESCLGLVSNTPRYLSARTWPTSYTGRAWFVSITYSEPRNSSAHLAPSALNSPFTAVLSIAFPDLFHVTIRTPTTMGILGVFLPPRR